MTIKVQHRPNCESVFDLDLVMFEITIFHQMKSFVGQLEVGSITFDVAEHDSRKTSNGILGPDSAFDNVG